MLSGTYLPDPNATSVLPGNYVRNALKEGLRYQQTQGINPFQLGFVGGTDNHNVTPGASVWACTTGAGAVADTFCGTVSACPQSFGLTVVTLNPSELCPPL